MSWAEAKGVSGVDRIESAFFKKGGHDVRGMAAKETSAPGPLLKVPQELLLAVENPSLNQGLFPDPSASGGGQTDDNRVRLLGLVAAHQKLGEKSAFGPYLQELPSLDDFRGFHPVMASPALLSEFEDAPLTQLVRQRQEEQERQWQRWQELLGEGGPSPDLAGAAAEVQRDDFVWAYMVCLTRCFDLHWTKEGGQIADTVGLVPVADNCNTDADPNVWWRADRSDPQKPTMQLSALRQLSPGDEILIPYAAEERPKTNEDFAEEWGFPLAGNKNALEQWTRDDRRCQELPTLACKEQSEDAGPPQPGVRGTFLAVAAEHCAVSLPNCTSTSSF